MATMVSAVYDAFLDAGASQDKARKAAEAMVVHGDRAQSLQQDSAGEFAKIEQRFTKVEGELTLLKWMVGATTALVIAVLLKLLFP